jgi:hypothetical protein
MRFPRNGSAAANTFLVCAGALLGTALSPRADGSFLSTQGAPSLDTLSPTERAARFHKAGAEAAKKDLQAALAEAAGISSRQDQLEFYRGLYGVWAALGEPISPLDGHKQPYHIAGSDASGIVWAIGSKVKRWKLGDEVVIHCNQDDGDDEECNGGDPMFSSSQRIWGYETPDGAFAQFTRVQDRQCMERPKHLSWEESACYTLTLATTYRMLFGHRPIKGEAI